MDIEVALIVHSKCFTGVNDDFSDKRLIVTLRHEQVNIS